MLTLYQSLQTLPWHLIAVIGRHHYLTLSSSLTKEALIDKVSSPLLDPAYLANLWPQLPQDYQHLLTDLLSAGGSLPAPHLSLRYGQRRPHRDLLAAHRHQQPVSIIEQLILLGLIFLDQASNLIYIPVDLQLLLPQPKTSPSLTPTSGGGTAPADLLIHDLAVLLGLLQREAVSPLHQRWLPPTLLKTWEQHCRVDPVFPGARSELQTGRRRFIHYLAEGAGFVTGPGSTVLVPIAAAWLWLEAAPRDRWQRLWETWNRPKLALWQQYRLPGAAWLTDPVSLLDPLHQALSLLDPTQPQEFAETLLRRRPDLPLLLPPAIPDRLKLMSEIIVQLLIGPLVWLGVLSEQGRKDYGPAKLENLSPAPQPPRSSAQGASASLYLTTQGQAWLTSQSPPEPPAPAKFTISANIQSNPLDSSLTLTLNGGLPDPADLVVAIELKDELGMMKDESGDSPKHSSFIIHHSSFIRALHRGWAAVALVQALNRLTERPLNSQELALLRAWTEAADRMVIHRGMILEVADPAIITRLTSARRGRELIHRTLSPRAVMVDPAKLDALSHRLTEQEGTPPFVQGSRGAEEQRGKEHLPPAPLPPRTPASYLWLALQVYQALGQHLPLPARIPQAILDQVRAAAEPEALAAAEVAAEQTLAALQRVLDGYTAFPPWPEGSLPVERSLPIIEQALATGQNLDLLYYAAGTNRVTRRAVEPYRVEWHGDTPYLIGFCQEAQAERMFRLDRVREIEVTGRIDQSSEFPV